MRRALSGLVFLFATGWLLLLVFVRWGDRPRPWPIELLDTFWLGALALLLALGPLALLLRSRALLGLLLATWLVFAQQYGHLFLPSPVIAAPEGPGFRLLTYNVLGTKNDARGLVELARAEQPDVIVLQELTTSFAEDLQRQLGDSYPYRATTDLGPTNDGGGVLSRVPIIESKPFRISDDGNAFQRLRLRINDRTVTLFNVHTESPQLRTRNPPGLIPPIVRGFGSPDRDAELDWLIHETAGLLEPYILAGDFNLAAGSRPYRHFPARWHDAFAERGQGFGHTFPTRYSLWSGRIRVTAPVVRIDYILTSPDLSASRAWVPWADGSDHLPVMAELHLRSTQR